MLASETAAWGLLGIMHLGGAHRVVLGGEGWGFGMGTWALYNYPVYLKISAKEVKPRKTVLCFLQVHMRMNTDMYKCLQGVLPTGKGGPLWGGTGGWEGQLSMRMCSLTFGALFYGVHA